MGHTTFGPRLFAVVAAVFSVAALAATALQAAPGADAASRGGTLRYAIDGDGTGFQPVFNACAQACQTISRAIFDPLTAINANGDVVPYLARSVRPNKTFTQWTIVARPGIKFHNGEAFDGKAMQANLEAYRKSAITGPGFADITAVDLVGPMTVRVKLKGPWVRFPETLSGQGGWMIAPSTLDNKDAALRPIGTGPFRFQEWKQGERLVVTRNATYWRRGLPYLDRIEFVPIGDPAARTAALRQGQVQMAMTNDNTQISRMKGISNVKLLETTFAASTDQFVLNNETAPTNDIRVRKALVYATDQAALRRVVGAGIVRTANGPFPPGNIGYQTKTIFPTYNLPRAQALVRAYEADKGPVRIRLQITPNDAVRGQLTQSMWQRAGIDVDLVTKDPQAQITDLLLGNYQVAPGQLPGAPDPGTQNLWWNSANIAPIGKGVSLNYLRIRDGVIDRAMKTLRENGNPQVRRDAARTITARFAKNVYTIWNYWTVWGLGYAKNVNNPDVMILPNGQKSAPYREGTNWVAQINLTR